MSVFLRADQLLNLRSFKDWIFLLRSKKFFLVRSPKKRLVSAYADKFQQHPLKVKTNDDWQHCQKIFFPFLSLDKENDSVELIRDAFVNTSFEDFMNLLPYVYQKDCHFLPQSAGIKAKTFLFLFNVKIIKMEQAPDLEYLKNIIDLDLSKKFNNTNNVEKPIFDLTPELKSIYNSDFILLGYER